MDLDPDPPDPFPFGSQTDQIPLQLDQGPLTFPHAPPPPHTPEVHGLGSQVGYQLGEGAEASMAGLCPCGEEVW